MKKHIFILLITLGVFNCFSQTIKNFTVLPSSPTSTSVVKIITHLEFSSNANLVSGNVVQLGNVFQINRCYSLGMLPIMDQKKDTLSLGTLAPGTYTVQYNGALTNSLSNCFPPSQSFTSSLTFTVLSTPSSIEEWTGLQKFHLYPNPFSDQMMIDAAGNARMNICIYDSYGKLVLTKHDHRSGEWLNLSGLKDGIYFIQAFENERQLFKAKLLKRF